MSEDQHLIDELKYNLEREDFIKAKILLSHLPNLSVETQDNVLLEISQTPGPFSLSLLVYLITSVKNISVPYEDMYDMLLGKIIHHPNTIRDLLSNDEIKEKHILIELAGELQPEGIENDLLKLLKQTRNDEEMKFICSVLADFPIQNIINVINPDFPAISSHWRECCLDMLVNNGSLETVNCIADQMGKDVDSDLDLLNFLKKINNQFALDRIVSAIQTHHPRVRNAAKSILLNKGFEAIPSLAKYVTSEDTDLVIQILNTIGEIGSAAGITPIKLLLQTFPKDPNVRFAAYEALGMLPIEKGLFILLEGLSDPDDLVCIATAKAIELNHNHVILNGIKNLIHEQDENAQRIAQAFLSSESEIVFQFLIGDELFQNYALPFLAHEAHPGLQKKYISLLKDLEFDELVSVILPEEIVQATNKLNVIAVDDSKTILNIYRQLLHQIGVESTCYEFPREALEVIRKTKPDVLITDLNMPEISGLDLTRSVRKLYQKSELPIIMITTQSDDEDQQIVLDAGVDLILPKPFTKAALEKAFEALTGRSS